MWRLGLSISEFEQLEKAIADCNPSELEDPKNALATIVYIAEWYKRKYRSGNKNPFSEKINYEALWNNSGINQKKYLYRDSNGDIRWQYSLYVLGGLAIQHELNRNDKGRFLKALCRIYHGENYTLENLDEAARAIAFRESIRKKHSLYEYMREILNDGKSHSEDTDEVRFIDKIKAANDEILRIKFRLEWLVNFSPEYNFMSRKLAIWFKPEEVGGGLHQYLSFDRVHLWGVPHPETQEHLYLYIRYRQDGKMVDVESMDKPIVTYLNHGVNDFVAFGAEKGVQIKDVPVSRFDTIELIVKDDDGNEYIAQQHNAMEYMQLWRCESNSDTWTSTQNAQKQTALLFSNKCQLKDEALCGDLYRKTFRNTRQLGSEIWNWAYIYDAITFTDEKDKEQTLYNRIGYDQISTRLYADTIHYVNGGLIKHHFIFDEDESDELDTEYLPLIFKKEDIIVRHFATKDAIKQACVDSEGEAEKVEFKQSNGNYALWTAEVMPPYGVNTFRIWIKGLSSNRDMIYLPAISKEHPILRDFDNAQIRYANIRDLFHSEDGILQDSIPMDGNVLQPTKAIRYGEETNGYEVDVFRPTLIKEILLDGKIERYLQDGENLYLPYILKDRVQVNDFSHHGYQAYQCQNLCSIYQPQFINISGNENAGWAALAAWEKNYTYAGKLLDPIAPECIGVNFGETKEMSIWENVYAKAWNYDRNELPVKAQQAPEFGVLFQDLSKCDHIGYNHPVQNDTDPWGFDDVDVDIIQCFEIANEANIYFFIMRPLIDMNKRDYVSLLYKPLLSKRNGLLTEKDKTGLKRFAEEFAFAWENMNIYIDNE